MTKPNNTVVITPGTGASIATFTIPGTSDEAQVVVLADESGHIIGTLPTYFYSIASAVHVNVASTVFWDMFNADATLLVRVLSIKHIPNVTTAVTGIVFDWLLERTTSAGTGGTAQTAWLPDTSQTALDADITCRLKPSGAAAQSTDLVNWSMSSEETNAGTIMMASLGGLELVPEQLRPISAGGNGQGILLRQNQGLRAVQITASVAGNSGFLIGFTVE